MTKPKPTQDNDALSGFRARGDVIPIWALLAPHADNAKVYAAYVPWVPLSMRDQPPRVEFPRKALEWLAYMGMRRPRYMWMIDPPPGLPAPRNRKE